MTPAQRYGREIDHVNEITACLAAHRQRAVVLAAQHDVWNTTLGGLTLIEPVTDEELTTYDRWYGRNMLHAYPNGRRQS